MARPLRIEYEGALYHIAARGNERNPIYRGEGDYQKFLEILSKLPLRYGIILHGYVLMENHYHLLIETPKGNITKTMHWLNATYTGFFNQKYKRAGHLFQGRYKGLLIEKERYLVAVSRYIHLNPVRALMVRKPEGYRWSSYTEYIGKEKKSKWLRCDWILGQYSLDDTRARKQYKAFVEEGLTLNENPFKELKGRLILGNEDLINGIKKRIKLKRHREIPESKRLVKSIKYEDVITAVTNKFEISGEKIKETGKRNNLARKVSLYLLRWYTDMSNAEIAEYFGIGYTAVSQAAARLRVELEKDRRLKKSIQEMEKELLLLSEE
ncbi:MAG: transposase [Nitrospirae bacterium]|nr:transposase [Nitrospirota bacterium]